MVGYSEVLIGPDLIGGHTGAQVGMSDGTWTDWDPVYAGLPGIRPGTQRYDWHDLGGR
jgi:hypothetical protein